MRNLSGLTLLLIFSGMPLAIGQVNDPRNRLSVEDGILKRGESPYRFRTIEVSGLAKPGVTRSEIAQALNRAAEVGASGVCFDLQGLSRNGAVLSDAGEKAVREIVQEARDRYMTVVCRVPGVFPGGLDRRAYLTAARTVARRFRDEYRVLYWIDGSHSREMAAVFKRTAPGLVVAASEGGHIRTIREPEPGSSGPLLLLNEMPPRGLGMHVILFEDGYPYEILERESALPFESEPWEPGDWGLSSEEKAEGFISLFDGVSLEGWTILGNPNGFVVNEGAIRWNERGGGMLQSRDRYGDFVLRLEYRIERDGNSGIFLRAPRTGRASRSGMEFQIMGDHGRPPTRTSTGAIYDVYPPRVMAGRPEGEWNEVEITLRGTYLRWILNGEVIQEMDFRDDEELAPRLDRGFIGLQDHNSPVAFRKIRIRE